MFHCLSQQELSDFIDHLVLYKMKDDKILNAIIQHSQDWHQEIIILAYFLTIVLARKKKENDYNQTILDSIYGLPEDMFLEINGFNNDFIKFLLINIRDKSLSLEEDLLNIHNLYKNYDYTKTLRL